MADYRKQLVKYLRVRERNLDPNTAKTKSVRFVNDTKLIYVFRVVLHIWLEILLNFKPLKLLSNQITCDRNGNFNLNYR